MWPSLSKPRSEAGTFFFYYTHLKNWPVFILTRIWHTHLYMEQGEDAFETQFLRATIVKNLKQILCRFHQDLNSDNWIQVQSANH